MLTRQTDVRTSSLRRPAQCRSTTWRPLITRTHIHAHIRTHSPVQVCCLLNDLGCGLACTVTCSDLQHTHTHTHTQTHTHTHTGLNYAMLEVHETHAEMYCVRLCKILLADTLTSMRMSSGLRCTLSLLPASVCCSSAISLYECRGTTLSS